MTTLLHTAATDPALDADHTHSDHMIRYASDCARCVAEVALRKAAAAYRQRVCAHCGSLVEVGRGHSPMPGGYCAVSSGTGAGGATA